MARRILLRATNWIGDAVMSLPALRMIRGIFPGSRLAVLARPWVADLYARESFADEVILHQAGRGPGDWAGKWRLAGQLRARRFDTAILFQNAFEAALLAWLAGIPERIGYDRDGRRLLLTRPVRVPAPGETPPHQSYYYLEMLLRAGLIRQIPQAGAIRLEGAGEAAAAGARRFAGLGLAGPVVGVSPGAAYGGAKRWLPERFAEAARLLAVRLDAGVGLFGSAAERDLCETVAGHLAGLRVRNLAGRTGLREFIDMAAACRVFLTNDSGAMHVASALGVPTVAVFGATDDIATGPAGNLAAVVRHRVECSPCLLRECPIDHRCMTAVSAAEVAETALRLLDNG